MPIGRGIAQIQRFNVIQTTTTITSKNPDGYVVCNQDIQFNISVSPTVPDGGTVNLLNADDNSFLGTGVLTSNTTSITISLINTQPSYNIVARYLGTSVGNTTYLPSTSTPPIVQTVQADGYLTVNVSGVPSNACYDSDYNITASVFSAIPANNPINDGYVKFIGFDGATPFIIDGYVPVVNGVASGILDGYDGYVTVWPDVIRPHAFTYRAEFYPDIDCFLQTNSGDGYVILRDGYSTTTVLMDSIEPVPYLGNITYTATVTSGAPGTIVGSVLFFADGPKSIFLGNSVVTSGVAVLNVPYSAWLNETGIFTITASFVSEICWGASFDTEETTILPPNEIITDNKGMAIGTSASTPNQISTTVSSTTVNGGIIR